MLAGSFYLPVKRAKDPWHRREYGLALQIAAHRHRAIENAAGVPDYQFRLAGQRFQGGRNQNRLTMSQPWSGAMIDDELVISSLMTKELRRPVLASHELLSVITPNASTAAHFRLGCSDCVAEFGPERERREALRLERATGSGATNFGRQSGKSQQNSATSASGHLRCSNC